MMAIACVMPLAVIVALPFFGISSKWITIGSIGLMILLHALMIKHHFSNHDKHKGGAE